MIMEQLLLTNNIALINKKSVVKCFKNAVYTVFIHMRRGGYLNEEAF